ncbi:MAG: ribonuclease D [Gammaproteobacteria bacterium]|nr:ribonuclease D [Gammaproteobacteria bacterium]
MQPFYVSTESELRALCQRFSGSAWLALDTEFMRTDTFYARLCLIQVACEQGVACIDPLALDDPSTGLRTSLSPLRELLYDPATVKVLHAAHQDLEILHDLYQIVPQPVFDTQLAAAMLGLGEQMGYAALVAQQEEVQLAKAHTRTDWAQRPLRAEQLDYAADDVRYLGPVYHKLRAALREKGWLDWYQEDAAALSDAARYINEPDEAWRRVGLAHTLSGAELAVLRALAAWRERRAQNANRPRKWIMDDALLLALARAQPATLAELGALGVSARSVERHGAELLKLIQEARRLAPEQWPAAAPPARLDIKQQARLDKLLALVTARAQQQGLNPAYVASRKYLRQMVLGDDQGLLRRGWRGELFGKELDQVLAGC